MENHPLVRKIYLYLFALVGLSLIVIGGVGLLNLGMKMTIFKQADREQAYWNKVPPCGTLSMEKLEKLSSESNVSVVSPNNNSAVSAAATLTEGEKTAIQRWLADYKNWEEQQKSFDYLSSQRQREASNSLAMIIIGLPLYLYHWRVIKREAKNA